MLLESYCGQSAINCSNNKQGWNKKVIVIEDDAVVNDLVFCLNKVTRDVWETQSLIVKLLLYGITNL